MSLTVFSLPVSPVGPQADAESQARTQAPDADFSALLLMLFASSKGIGELPSSSEAATPDASASTPMAGLSEGEGLLFGVDPLPPSSSPTENGSSLPDLLREGEDQGPDHDSSNLSLPFLLAVLQQVPNLDAAEQNDGLQAPGLALPQAAPGKVAFLARPIGAEARPDELLPDEANGLAIGLNVRPQTASLEAEPEGGLESEGEPGEISLPLGRSVKEEFAKEEFASELKGQGPSRAAESGSARHAEQAPFPSENRKEEVLSLVGKASPNALAAAEFEASPQVPLGSIQSSVASKHAAQEGEAGQVEFIASSEENSSGPAQFDSLDVEGQKAETGSGGSFSDGEETGRFAATLSGTGKAGEQSAEKAVGLRHSSEISAAMAHNVNPGNLGHVRGEANPLRWSPVIHQVAGEIFAQVRENRGEATIQLDPPELGGLKIDLKIDGDSVRARIVAESAETKGLIQDHLPELRQALQGHQLDLASVSVDVSGRGETGMDGWHGFSHNPNGQGEGGPFTGPQTVAEEKSAGTKSNAVLANGRGLSVWA